MTLLFQTFMMMNYFNMINCRVLGKLPGKKDVDDPAAVPERRELNMFTRIFDNWWFLIILLAELNLQYFMVGSDVVGTVFMTTPLTFGMHLTAILLGATSLGVSVLAKYTPERWLDKFPTVQEDEKYLQEQQRKMSAVGSQIESYRTD